LKYWKEIEINDGFWEIGFISEYTKHKRVGVGQSNYQQGPRPIMVLQQGVEFRQRSRL
jgi:hypothetical protein